MCTWTTFFQHSTRQQTKGTQDIDDWDSEDQQTRVATRNEWGKELEKEMSHGDIRSNVVDGVECVVWKDKRIVTLVNNITDPEAVSTVLRRNKDGTRSSVSCPESVQRYNSYMGGVDMFDARRKTYSCSCKSRKWWLRLFYFLLDAAVTNAYILYKESNHTPALTMKEFVLKICECLVASTNC